MTERRVTRSQVPLSERNKVEVERQEQAKRRKYVEESAPFIKYEGKIDYHTSFVGCAEVCDNLLKQAENASNLLVLGFDLEWPFSFQTGPGKLAVIQISPNYDVCHVLQVSGIKSLPKTLSQLLIHPKVRLTGINIKNDIRKLARDFSGFDGDKIIENCIDLGPLANGVCDFKQRWSMEKLVKHFFELRINKDKSVRMSKWHVIPLSTAQQIYAAIDAYASLKLYCHIKKLEEVQVEEENEN